MARGVNLSEVTKKLILKYEVSCLTVKILKLLRIRHKLDVTRQSIRRFILKFNSTGTTRRRPVEHDRRQNIWPVHLNFLQMCLSQNPESMAQQLKKMLDKHFDVSVSREY